MFNAVDLLFIFRLNVICQTLHLQLPMLADLPVLLGQGTGHGCQELVHCHVGLRGEILGEHVGHDHKDAVGEELSKKEEKKLTLRLYTWVQRI